MLGTTEAMISGNVNQGGTLKYSGPGNDRAPILNEIGGVDPTVVVISVYSSNDTNMDGHVKYSGPGNDRAPILTNLGGIDPTQVLIEQLP